MGANTLAAVYKESATAKSKPIRENSFKSFFVTLYHFLSSAGTISSKEINPINILRKFKLITGIFVPMSFTNTPIVARQSAAITMYK